MLLACALSACDGGGPAVTPDASVEPDAGIMVEEPFLPWPEDAPPVVLPNFLPCPAGWGEVDDGDVVTCAPFSAGVADLCEPGLAHFPGETGCRIVGDACPAGSFAEGLPTDGTVIHIDPAAAPGGDGSRSAPLRLLSEVVWPSLLEGTTIALAKGEFAGIVPLPPGVHLAGACASETVLLGLDSSTLATVIIDEAGTAATVRNLTIRGSLQPGLRAEYDGHLEASGVIVDGARLIGVYAGGALSKVTLTDVVIRNTLSDTDGRGGRGLNAQFGGRIIGTRVIVDRNRDTGVFVAGNEASVTLIDSVISNTLPRELNEIAGRGVGIQDTGRFEATRTLIAGNHELGIFAGRDGSAVVLTDVIIADTLPQGGGADNFGRGVAIQDGASLEATRLVVEGSHDAGFSLSSPRTVAILTDVVVRDTEPELRTGAFGRGLNVQDGSLLTANRMLIANNFNVGLVISGTGAESDLQDVTILDTHVDFAQGDRGYGMHVQLEAQVTARGLAIRSSQTLGIAGIHSTLDLEDVVVYTTTAAPCTRSSCSDTPFGYGVAAISSSMRLTDFVVSDADTCGVFVSGDGGALDLARGVVTGANIGACVQVSDYDFDRLTDGVTYVDNVQNLDATSLPVPGPVTTARPR